MLYYVQQDNNMKKKTIQTFRIKDMLDFRTLKAERKKLRKVQEATGYVGANEKDERRKKK